MHSGWYQSGWYQCHEYENERIAGARSETKDEAQTVVDRFIKSYDAKYPHSS